MKHNKQEGTKGILNVINERYGCNQKKRSVPINDLIRYHKPKQQTELIALIESHTAGGQHNNCACNCKSAGKLEDFANNLYNAYGRYLLEVDNQIEYKDWDDCYIFMKNLFVVNSLKGNDMENKVLVDLKAYLDKHFNTNKVKYTIDIADGVHDFKYSVDLVIHDAVTGIEIFGVQVKPLTYKNFQPGHPVLEQNKRKNLDYGKPVVYVYYNSDNLIDSPQVSNSEFQKCLLSYEGANIHKVEY